MNHAVTITITGPQGSGKSTLAREIIAALSTVPEAAGLMNRFQALEETDAGLEVARLRGVPVLLRTSHGGDL